MFTIYSHYLKKDPGANNWPYLTQALLQIKNYPQMKEEGEVESQKQGERRQKRQPRKAHMLKCILTNLIDQQTQNSRDNLMKGSNTRVLKQAGAPVPNKVVPTGIH